MGLANLSGKRCLVTGASRGLGLAIAKALVAANAKVFMTAKGAEALSIEAGALGMPNMPADLANIRDVEHLAAKAVEEFGSIDILVNSAGIFPVASAIETDLDEFDQCMAINVRAPFQLARKFIPAMVKNNWGRILNIGSSSAYAGFKNTSVYCASKHALLGMTRALHDEVKAANVRVQCISPGSIKTDMGRQVVGQDFETFLDANEIAQVALDILSMDGAMIMDEVRLNRMVIR